MIYYYYNDCQLPVKKLLNPVFFSSNIITINNYKVKWFKNGWCRGNMFWCNIKYYCVSIKKLILLRPENLTWTKSTGDS